MTADTSYCAIAPFHGGAPSVVCMVCSGYSITRVGGLGRLHALIALRQAPNATEAAKFRSRDAFLWHRGQAVSELRRQICTGPLVA